MNKITLNGTSSSGNSDKSVRLETLTGEQFKQLIEQVKQSGNIDTLPELFAFLSGIPEGTTLLQYLQEHAMDEAAVQNAIDDKFEEEQCTDDDIDSIFDDSSDSEDSDSSEAPEDLSSSSSEN